MNGIHEVTGSIPVWSTIRLTFGSLTRTEGSLMASHLHVECPE